MKQFFKYVILLALLALVVSIMPLSTHAQGNEQTHVVQSGENLYRIALRYGLNVDQLVVANQIVDPSQIYVGQILNIPSASSEASPAVENSAEPVAVAQSQPATAPIYHIVEVGQSLASIGLQYGVTWVDLANWNGITEPNTIYAGQRLVVNVEAAPDSAAVAGPTIVDAQPVEQVEVTESATASQTHIVKPGERLASIARDYGISWTTIARANNIGNPNTIYVGQVLNIPAQDDAPGTYLEPNWGVPSAPAPTSSTGKQIMVKLSTQQVFAYENGQLLKTVTASTGLPGTPTVTGNYRVYWKLSSQTMSGPGYYLPGVPYVMYFYQGYALHGTYWHNNFGQPMSHGCVNLPTTDAQWFFNWAELGTPVSVSY